MSRYIASEFIKNKLERTTWGNNNSRRITWLSPSVNVSCLLQNNNIIQPSLMHERLILHNNSNSSKFPYFLSSLFHLEQTIIDYDSIHRGMALNKSKSSIIKGRCISIIDNNINNNLIVSSSIIRMHQPPIGIKLWKEKKWRWACLSLCNSNEALRLNYPQLINIASHNEIFPNRQYSKKSWCWM